MALPTRGASFRRLVVRVAVLPVVLLVILAGVLVWQIQHLLASAAWVEHTDQVITNGTRLLRLYVDMETGLRGFLITQDRAFLEPLDRGRADIPALTRATHDLMADNPPQQARLSAIDAAWRQWEAYADDEIARRAAAPESVETAKRGKAMMDVMRGQFAALLDTEEALRLARGREAIAAARRGVLIACVAAVSVGGLLAVLSRRELDRLARTYEEALATADALATGLECRVAERTAELKQSNDSLGEANRELEAFAHSISHDLRAPLRHIGGFALLLQKSAGPMLSADDAENLSTIGDTAKLAGRMVDDLLSFSRIGRADLRRDAVDMNELFERCRRELAPETRGRDITWTVADLPPATGDAPLLKLVVSNLLSNAVKYTSKQAHAAIDVRAGHGDAGVTYHVRDDGVGFDMAYAHKLFGVFQRLHRAEEYEGTGIGLANVRRIITRHGGRVWADARLGEGATFSFTLPAARADETI